MSGGIPVEDALAVEAELEAQDFDKSSTTYQAVVDIMDKLGIKLSECIPCPEIEATFMFLSDNGWDLKETGEVEATLTPMRDGMPNPKYNKLYIDKPWMDWWKARMTQRETLGTKRIKLRQDL